MAALLQTASSDQERGRVFTLSCPTFVRVANADHLSQAERIDLDRLRWMSLRSHLAPKPDLERACFLLAGESGVSFERFAIAFFRGLGSRARRPMAFYRPGTAAVGDDELWLMRLMGAWSKGDEAGAGALVAWRVQPASQRWLRFLSSSVAKALRSEI